MKISYLFFLSLVYTSLFGLKPESVSVDHYRIRLDKTNTHLVKVEADLTLEDALLYMSSNGPVPEWWPKYIENLKIYDENGQALEVNRRDSTGWIIERAYPGMKIRLSYEVLMQHENKDWPGGIDGVAFVREWGIMASGRSLFIMNGASDKTNISVEFTLPTGWKVTTPWTKIDEAIAKYEVPNLLQLQESLLFAGTHQEINLSREQFVLTFVLGGSAIEAKQVEYVQMAGQLLDYYIEMMGGIPRPEPGNDLSRVVVIINQSDQIDGEVIGNHISLLLNPNEDMEGQIIGWFLFAHEFFHLWNGKSLRFEGTEADWFKEGITNYYTLKALKRIGFAGEKEILMILNNLFYARYLSDTGYGQLAPAKAASGFDKDNHWGLIYGGGLFAGICIDMDIRHHSYNTKSLDHLMRYFYKNYAGTEKTISNENILDQANNLVETDFAAFMEAHIQGSQVIDLADYLQYAGVQVDTTGGQLELKPIEDRNELQNQLWQGFLGEN